MKSRHGIAQGKTKRRFLSCRRLWYCVIFSFVCVVFVVNWIGLSNMTDETRWELGVDRSVALRRGTAHGLLSSSSRLPPSSSPSSVDGDTYEIDLVFVHIPKTGGSSIENSAHDRSIEWGFCLVCPAACPNPIDFATFSFPKLCSQDHLRELRYQRRSGCSAWHDPGYYRRLLLRKTTTTRDELKAGDGDIIPSKADERKWSKGEDEENPKINEFNNYQKRKRRLESFCVVRDPYERIISSFKFYKGVRNKNELKSFQCDKAGLNQWIEYQMAKVHKNARVDNCHFVPQSAYPCHHYLNFAFLEMEFDALMSRLWKHDRQMKKLEAPLVLVKNADIYSTGSHCPALSVDSLTEKSRTILNEYFAEDFKLMHRLGFSN